MSTLNHKHLENKSVTTEKGGLDAGEYTSSCLVCFQEIKMSYYYDDDRGTVYSKWS